MPSKSKKIINSSEEDYDEEEEEEISRHKTHNAGKKAPAEKKAAKDKLKAEESKTKKDPAATKDKSKDEDHKVKKDPTSAKDKSLHAVKPETKKDPVPTISKAMNEETPASAPNMNTSMAEEKKPPSRSTFFTALRNTVYNKETCRQFLLDRKGKIRPCLYEIYCPIIDDAKTHWVLRFKTKVTTNTVTNDLAKYFTVKPISETEFKNLMNQFGGSYSKFVASEGSVFTDYTAARDVAAEQADTIRTLLDLHHDIKPGTSEEELTKENSIEGEKRDPEGFIPPASKATTTTSKKEDDTIQLKKEDVTHIMAKGRLPYAHIVKYLGENVQIDTIKKLEEHWQAIFRHETALQTYNPSHFLQKYDEEVAASCIKEFKDKYKVQHNYEIGDASTFNVNKADSGSESEEEERRRRRQRTGNKKDEKDVKRVAASAGADHSLVKLINRLQRSHKIPFSFIQVFFRCENLTDILRFLKNPTYLRHIVAAHEILKAHDNHFLVKYDREQIISALQEEGFDRDINDDQWPPEYFPIKKLKID